jgi:hypothetical protein
VIQVEVDGATVGTIALADDALTGSTPSLQRIANQAVRRAGSPAAGYAALRNTSNGYVTYRDDDVAKGWGDAWEHELRGHHGEWEHSLLADAGAFAEDGGAKEANLERQGTYFDRESKKVSADSLRLARGMMVSQPVGDGPPFTDAEQAVATVELGRNLDKIPPAVRTRLAGRFHFKVVNNFLNPEGESVAHDPGSDILGITGPWDPAGGDIKEGADDEKLDWEIRVRHDMLYAPDPVNRDVRSAARKHVFVVSAAKPGDYSALRHVVSHEFGHALFDEGAIDGDAEGGTDTINAIGEDFMRALAGTHEDLGPTATRFMAGVAMSNMGAYAATSADEAIAEAWAAFMNGTPRSPGYSAAETLLGSVNRYSNKGHTWSATGRCSGIPATMEAFIRRFGEPRTAQQIADSLEKSTAVPFSVYNALDGVNPALVKVGKEGYIHGWICVRPPCGADDKAKLTEQSSSHIFRGPEGTPFENRSVHGYTVTHAGTGQHVGYIVPTSRGTSPSGLEDVGFFAHRGDGARSPIEDDPQGALRHLTRMHDMALLTEAADKGGLPKVHRELALARSAMNKLQSGDPEAVAAERLRKAVAELDKIPPVTDPREAATSQAKLVEQLRKGASDMHYELTGDDIPDNRNWKIPDEPWAKAGKVRQQDLDVRWHAVPGAGPPESRPFPYDNAPTRTGTVTDKRTGIKIGTIQKEWISKGDPHATMMKHDSKAYYTTRHADGSVTYFGASDAHEAGADKALRALMYAHNQRLVPQPPREEEPPVPAPAEAAPDWFDASTHIHDAPSPTAKAETERMLKHQGRYVPKTVSGAHVYFSRTGAGAGSERGSEAGFHYAHSGKIYLAPNVMGDRDPEANGHGSTHFFTPVKKKDWSYGEATLAHEVGHGVDAARGGMPGPVRNDPRMWLQIADAIGVMPPKLNPDDSWGAGKALNTWMGANKAKIQREISTYAGKNNKEMLAELWAEYTTARTPRPPAQAYGDYVMRHMPGRTEPIR